MSPRQIFSFLPISCWALPSNCLSHQPGEDRLSAPADPVPLPLAPCLWLAWQTAHQRPGTSQEGGCTRRGESLALLLSAGWPRENPPFLAIVSPSVREATGWVASRLSGLRTAAPVLPAPVLDAGQNSGLGTGRGWQAGDPPYLLGHGEGQLEVLPPLHRAQGIVVEGIGEEGVHQGAEGHPVAPAGGEVLQVHVLRGQRREVRGSTAPASAPPPDSTPQAGPPSPSPGPPSTQLRNKPCLLDATCGGWGPIRRVQFLQLLPVRPTLGLPSRPGEQERGVGSHSRLCRGPGGRAGLTW